MPKLKAYEVHQLASGDEILPEEAAFINKTTERLLQKLKISAQTVISGDSLAQMKLFPQYFDEMVDITERHLLLGLQTFMWATQVQEDTQSEDVPKSWWQALKFELYKSWWVPNFVKRWFPVQTTARVTSYIRHYHACPHISSNAPEAIERGHWRFLAQSEYYPVETSISMWEEFAKMVEQLGTQSLESKTIEPGTGAIYYAAYSSLHRKIEGRVARMKSTAAIEEGVYVDD